MKESGRKSTNELMDANTRACDTVFNCMVTFPQSGESAALIAERALWQLKGDIHQPSLTELANIKPDGECLAERVNKVHDQYDVPRWIKPERAEAFISGHAGGAVEWVRKKTIDAADKTQTSIPDDIRNPIMTGLYEINPERAEVLEKTLKTHPDLLEEVYQEFTLIAAGVKARSKDQREFYRGRG